MVLDRYALNADVFEVALRIFTLKCDWANANFREVIAIIYATPNPHIKFIGTTPFIYQSIAKLRSAAMVAYTSESV